MIYECSLSGANIRVVQDSTHLGQKARNRMLKDNIKLPMGSHVVSIDHLKKLVINVHKSVHGLTFSDVFPVDRMNYGSFEKVVQDRVINALREKVPDSEAAIQYLLTFRDIVGSFLQHDMKPLDRIFKMFRGVFVLRIWREFIISSRMYTLQQNFITYNTYMCVEINSKNLVELMKSMRNSPDQFLPPIFDSQACERAFRQFRSMGTTQFTKINFSILELIHMIGRVEVQNNINYCKLNIDGINLPHKRKGKTNIYELPTDSEIEITISKAKQEVLQIAEKFGMTPQNISNIDHFEFISRLSFNQNDDEIYADFNDEDHDEDNFIDHTLETFENADELVDLDEMDENSPLVCVEDENGDKKIISKSAYLWMITEPGLKMSNDRYKRFRISRKRKADET